jgi:hypothetical protein
MWWLSVCIMLFVPNEISSPYSSLVGLLDHSLYRCSPLYVSLKKYYFILMRLSNLDRISINSAPFNANCLLSGREKCGEEGAERCEGCGGVMRRKTGKFGVIIVRFLQFHRL